MQKVYIKNYISDAIPFYTRYLVRSIRQQCHMHDYVEILYIVEGEAIHHINDNTYECSCGMLYIIDVGGSHQIEITNELKYYDLYIEKNFFDHSEPCALLRNHMESYGSPAFCLEQARQANLANLMKIMSAEFNTAAKDQKIAMSLLSCFSLIAIHSTPLDLKKRTAQRKFFSAPTIVDYINMHFTENISLADIAKIYNYNPSYLSRYIKEKCGVSYTDYINTLRIRRARHLLISTDYSIKLIERMSGYSGHQSFYRKFEKAYGVSPQKYRIAFRTESIKQNMIAPEALQDTLV